jgi:hypothetical protein
VTATWSPERRLSLATGFTNLADARFADPGTVNHVQDVIGQNGRTFWARIEVRP